MYFVFSLDITTLLRFSLDKFYSFYFPGVVVLRSRPGPSNSALSFLLIIQAKGDEMMHGTARYDIVLWGDWFIPHPPPGPSFFFHHQKCSSTRFDGTLHPTPLVGPLSRNNVIVT